LMRKLLLDAGGIPRELLSVLPSALFEGAVVNNDFMQLCLSADARGVLPPRFTLLLALDLTEHRYEHHEFVYHAHDHAFNLFLVIQGTFAHIARPTKMGGQAEVLKSPVMARAIQPSGGDSTKYQTSFSGFAFAGMGTKSSPVSSTHFSCLPSTNRLHPFQLFSSRAYCGDVELFSGKTRHSSLRNETTDQEGKPSEGVALVMTKGKLESLCYEFPHYKEIWMKEANRRERYREHLFSNLTQGRQYKDLAVTSIQKRVRQYMQQKRRRPAAALMDGSSEENNLELQPIRCDNHKKGSMLLKLNQLRAANVAVPIGAPKLDRERSDRERSELGVLHQEVQAHGKQLEQALEGINLLLGHRTHGYSASSDAKSPLS